MENLTSKFTQIEKEKLILTRKYHRIKETIPSIYYTRKKILERYMLSYKSGTNH